MKTCVHPLWGYSFDYPENWHHLRFDGVDGFAAIPEALQSQYSGTNSGYILVKTEFNPYRKDVGPFWQQHIALTAGFLGARKLGAAPWRIGDATGIEAEILLPKIEGKRLWAGILARDFMVLSFVVSHPLEERQAFEPIATHLISSLRFLPSTCSGCLTSEGIPLPPDYQRTDPRSILADIEDPSVWQAFQGVEPIDALQCYFLREAVAFGWDIQDYHPFPGDSGLGFARFRICKDEKIFTVGIMPFGKEKVTSCSPAWMVIKRN